MPALSLNLTDDQLDRIAAALLITSPSGGGSTQYTLFREFCRQVEAQTGRDLDTDHHLRPLCEVVISDAEEAGEVVRAAA